MSKSSTKKVYEDYELRDEYDLSALPVVASGRYAPEHRTARNLIVLDPDVADAFPSDKAVNEALRLVLQIARIAQQQASAAQP